MATQVLICGAGPVGLLSAYLLKRLGIEFRIIDTLDAPNPWSKALVLQSRSLEIMETLGLIDRFMATGTPLNSMNIFSGKKPLARIPFKYTDSPMNFVLGIPQYDSERVLTEALTALDAYVERGTRLKDCTIEKDHAVVTLEKAGQTERLTCDYVIAADGSHSTLRHLFVIPFEGEALKEHFAMLDCQINWDRKKDALYAYLHTDGPLAIFPVGRSAWRLILGIEASKFETAKNDSLEKFEAIMKKRAGLTVKLSDPTWQTAFSIQSRQIKHYRHKRVFFMGDAAHSHSPVGGQGMNTGMQDAYNLCWKLAQVLHHGPDEALLDSYHAERYPVAHALLQNTNRMTHLVATKNPMVRFIRNTVLRFISHSEQFKRKMSNLIGELNVNYCHLYKQNKTLGKLKAGMRVPNFELQDTDFYKAYCKGYTHHCFAFIASQHDASQVEKLIKYIQNKPYSIELTIFYRDKLLKNALPKGAHAVWDQSGEISQQFGTSGIVHVRPDYYIDRIAFFK